MKFENMWMAKYPKPLSCVHDQGPEFTGMPFQRMLAKYGNKSKPTITVLNPAAGNSICERMHQTMGNQLRALLHQRPPQNVREVEDIVDSVIASSISCICNRNRICYFVFVRATTLYTRAKLPLL